MERVPVQYILGDWDLHDLTLEMRPPVLIPRPETEELVEHVLEALGDDHRNEGRGDADRRRVARGSGTRETS